MYRRGRFKKSHNKQIEDDFYNKLKYSTDEEFNEFLQSIVFKINTKYSVDKERLENTQMKRSLLNVIYKHGLEENLPIERVKRIEKVFPLLKRVFFGRNLTKQIYSKKTHKRKFRFKIKPRCTIPKFDSIIDVAYILKTTVNQILGFCVTHDKRYINRYYTHSFSYYGKKKEYFSPFYKHFTLTKPDGRKRLIAIPVPILKKYQRVILKEILEKAILPETCTGFVPTKSTVSNARFQIAAQTLVKIDLRNFFNTLKFQHIFEVFRGFGYNRPVSGVLACLCSDFYYLGSRYAPQGSPASPMLANLYASHLDKRLEGLWNKQGFRYSRYADDLSFSSSDSKVKVRRLIAVTYKIIRDEKLYPNFEKTKVFRKGQKKTVTGITVNEGLNVDRKWLNQLRGEFYRIEKFGFPSEDVEEVEHILKQLQGKIAYLNMVNPIKAEKFMEKFNSILNSRVQ